MAGHSRPKDGVLRTPMSRPSTPFLLQGRRKPWMPATSAGMTLRVWRCFTTSTHARFAWNLVSGAPASRSSPRRRGPSSCEKVLDPRLRGD